MKSNLLPTLARRSLLQGTLGLCAYTTIGKAFAEDTKEAPAVTEQPAQAEVELPKALVPYTLPDIACFKDVKFSTPAKWGIVVSDDTKSALWEKNADARMAPSSMTKMMTAYVVFQKIKAGQISLKTEVTVTERAWKTGGSRMFLPLGEKVSVEDLLKGLLCVSGNDSAVALAEAAGPSYEEFIDAMNDWGKKIGLDNSHFVNPTGLPAKDHYMSARDIAKVACHLIDDFPEYYHYFSMTEYKYNKITQGNRNTLVTKGLADGLKTGHTDAGGFGLCASRTQDGKRFVCVLNGLKSMNQRAHEMEKLLDWSFREFNFFTLAKGQEVVTAPIPVKDGRVMVPLAIASDVKVMLPVSTTGMLARRLVYPSTLEAPVTAGHAYGKAIWMYKEQPVAAVELVASCDSPLLGFFDRLKQRLGLKKN